MNKQFSYLVAAFFAVTATIFTVALFTIRSGDLLILLALVGSVVGFASSIRR